MKKEKTCNVCGQTKNNKEFFHKSQYGSTICKSCYSTQCNNHTQNHEYGGDRQIRRTIEMFAFKEE